MKGIHIVLLVTVALHLVSANCNSQPCNNNNCNSQSCNSNNCNSQSCNNCNSQSCNNCNTQSCNSNNCNSQLCNSNNNCNQQPCNVPVEESGERVPVLVPFPNNDNQTNVQSNAHSINNTNINNSTTTITLTNTINTVNNISVPISLNSTNENTISVNFEASSTNGIVGTENVWDNISSDCCLVTTPVNCTEDGKNCTMVRRRECSDICRGIFPEYVNIPTPRVVVQQPSVQQPIIVQQPVVQQPVVQQPVIQRSFVVQQPVIQRSFVVQQPVVQQPVMFQQPTSSCGSATCGQAVQQPMVIQQPSFAYPVYQPAQSQQVYIRIPVGVNQRPDPVAQNVVTRQVVVQPQQSTVEGNMQLVKAGSIETDQGALSRLLVVPYNSYYGGSYQANVESGYQQLQYNVMPTMEAPCPYSNAGNIGFPSPCQQSPQIV